MDTLVDREIKSQLSLDTNLLLEILGSSSSHGATPGTSRDGRAILENAKRNLKSRICSDEAVRKAYSASDSSKFQLVAALVDCIVGFVHGVSPITVSVLLVREGVGSLCEGIWE